MVVSDRTAKQTSIPHVLISLICNSTETDAKLSRVEGPTKAAAGSTLTLKTIVCDTRGAPLTVDLADQIGLSVTGQEVFIIPKISRINIV